MPYEGTITKQVGEKFAIGFNLKSPDLESGETISSCTAAVSPAGLTLTGAVVIDGSEVAQMIESGTTATEYVVTFTITTSAGHIYLPEYLVKIE